MKARGIVVFLAAMALTAGNCNQNTPSQPPPQPGGPVTYSIAVSVQSSGGPPISGATILILDGMFAGQSFTTGGDGTITITGAQGNMNVEASALGFSSERLGVSPPSSSGQTRMLMFILQSQGTSFGPGTHLVGAEISAGRYFADPMSGCGWSRLSGLGGTFGEIIANEFLGSDRQQEVVDIRASDVAFESNGSCGRWTRTRLSGSRANIPPGKWVVGPQISPGTYRTTASAGCGWSRLRDFSQDFAAIIANDFVGSGGPQLVEIMAGDAGFETNAACGTWTRVASTQ